MPPMTDSALVLGPLLRYVDDTSATIWVETDAPCTVEVLGHRARTFTVAGHHYALVIVEGLGAAPAAVASYAGQPYPTNSIWRVARFRDLPEKVECVVPTLRVS